MWPFNSIECWIQMWQTGKRRKEGREGWISLPAGLVLQARLTSASAAFSRAQLPINIDGLRGVSLRREKKTQDSSKSLWYSSLLHTSNKPWPAASESWRVKRSRWRLFWRSEEIRIRKTNKITVKTLMFGATFSVTVVRYQSRRRTFSTPAAK